MLYIVATPIGNLDDISLRQAEILSKSDVILTEDTRSSMKLIKAIKDRFNFIFKENQLIESFYKENEYQKTFKILDELKKGKIIALISESGTPIVSDPGQVLLKEVIRNGLRFNVIPGPTALIAALINSGFDTSKFMYLGFIPKKTTEIRYLVRNIIKTDEILEKCTYIMYVSIHNLNNALKVFNELIPEAEICICREMTKKYEEIIRGNAKDLMNLKLKGEITLVIRLHKK